jgi:hypothetical protein
MECPICKGEIKGYPATSRADNSTQICTKCAIKEALNVFEWNRAGKSKSVILMKLQEALK